MIRQEVVHASWKLRDPSNVTLLDATFFDVRDSLLLVSEFDGFASGSFAGGSGANHIERGAKKAYTEMEAAVRYREELRKFPPVIKAEDSFEPPRIKWKGKRLFKGRYQKVMELKDIMKIADAKEISEAKRVYYVKNSIAGTARFVYRHLRARQLRLDNCAHDSCAHNQFRADNLRAEQYACRILCDCVIM